MIWEIKQKKKTKKNCKCFILSYFIGKNYFDNDGSKNHLIIQLDFMYFQIFSSTIDKFLHRNVKGYQKKVQKPLLHQKITYKKITPKLTYIHNSEIAVKFERNCFKRDKISFTHGNVVNFFIA